MDFIAVEGGAVAAAQRVEAAIELALEAVDHGRVEAGKALLVKHVVDPVLPLDQEMQPALAIFDVEGEQIADPGRQMLRTLGGEFERLAVGALVDDALAQRPGIDDVGDHARERGLRRDAAQLDDQLGAKRAHRCELEPDIGLIGKAGVDRDPVIDLLAPAAQLLLADRAVDPRWHQLGDELADMRARAVDDGAQPPYPVVEIDHPAKLVGDRLRGRDIRHRTAQRREEARRTPVRRRLGRRRMRLDIDEAPVDLTIGRPPMDRRDRKLKWPVVEHGAIDEGHRRRVHAGLLVILERLGDESLPPRPGLAALRHHLVHLHDLGRRKRARER